MANPLRPSSRTRTPLPQPAPQSLEAALDEERLEVMAALEGKRTASPAPRSSRTSTPPPPIRSMLDVDQGRIPRHGSIAGIGVGVTSAGNSPTQTRKQALDPADPSTWTSRHSSFASAPPSPEGEKKPPRARATSDVPKKPQGLPKIPDETRKDIDQDFKFDMPSTTPATTVPKRVTQPSTRPREGSGTAMAAALSGDFSSLHVGLPKGVPSGRHNSTVGAGGHSRSPSSRIRRSASPGLLGPNSPPARYVTDSGKQIKMDKAYKMLNKASGLGNSGIPAMRDDLEETGRVPKDNLEGDEEVVESSEEEYQSSSDELSDMDPSVGGIRGRRKRRAGSDAEGSEWVDEDSQPRSQMAAAEEERVAVSSAIPVRSLLEPEISITGPFGENVVHKKPAVHPSSAFDHSMSAATSQASSASDLDPELADISKARRLALNVSAVDSTVPDRVVQVVLRGDWTTIQQEADDGRRRQRLYLVATDLSDEAAYAIEWTIGTILRDGDTLLAMYAIEDERAGGGLGSGHGPGPKSSERENEVLHAEGVLAAKDAENAMESLTKKAEQIAAQSTPSTSPTHLSSAATRHFHPATDTDSVAGSVDARGVSKTQMERLRAADSLRATCLKYVRKTRLQVRIMIEVIHCKSPKHLVTGAIDELEPTLVVLGSRGRSALKGTLLGSMSNYIVTKSSVPVMVARKKLQKHVRKGADGARPVRIRLSNNLVISSTGNKRRSLKDAKIEHNIYKKK